MSGALAVVSTFLKTLNLDKQRIELSETDQLNIGQLAVKLELKIGSTSSSRRFKAHQQHFK